MLSVFPTLFAYTMVVPFIFRIVVGLSFLFFGYGNSSKNQEEKIKTLEYFKLKPGKAWLLALATIEGIGGILLIAGLYTQIIALIFSVILILGLSAKYKKQDSLPLSLTEMSLLFFITASLLFLGPGFYAIDLPL